MKKIKISAIFSLTLLLIFSSFVLFSCKKDDGNDGSGSGDDNYVYVISSDVFREYAKTNYRGEIEYIDSSTLTVRGSNEINESKTYYAIVKIPAEKFSRGRFSLSGDVKLVNSGVTVGESSLYKVKKT